MSDEALQIAEERRETKSEGERERYTHLHAEFQRTTRRDKKDFFKEQCKEIQENNRMGKSRDLLKKIGDIKGISHARMGTIKHRNDKDLTEAEEFHTRWQEYIEELYKEPLNDADNHNDTVTPLMSQMSWSVKSSGP